MNSRIKLFFYFCLISLLFLGTIQASNTLNIQVAKLNSMYQKGLARENTGAINNSYYAYLEVIKVSMSMLKNNSSQESVDNLLPYTISAAFRMGLINHWLNTNQADKLYDKLQSYQLTQKWLEDVLTLITNLYLDQNINIPKEQYNHLYFALAYNRLSWISTLIKGCIWKNYLLYLPADKILMLHQTAKDIKLMFDNYDINQTNMTLVKDKINKLFLYNNRSMIVTFQLSLQNLKINDLSNELIDQVIIPAWNFNQFYAETQTAQILRNVENFKTIQDYLSDKSESFFNVIRKMQIFLKQRK